MLPSAADPSPPSSPPSSASSYLCTAVKCVKHALLGIPVYLVLALIAADWYVFVVEWAFNPSIHPSIPVSLAWALLFTGIVLLILVCYFRTIFTSSAVRDNPPPPDYFQRLRSMLPGQTERICLKCRGAPKPLRAHHCSVCGECILKMDHHCPWVATCVGFKNYKFFVLFVLWACLGCFVYLIAGAELMKTLFSSTLEPVRFLHLITSLLTATFALSLLFFAGFHLHLIFTGQSTIEAKLTRRARREQAEAMAMRGGGTGGTGMGMGMNTSSSLNLTHVNNHTTAFGDNNSREGSEGADASQRLTDGTPPDRDIESQLDRSNSSASAAAAAALHPSSSFVSPSSSSFSGPAPTFPSISSSHPSSSSSAASASLSFLPMIRLSKRAHWEAVFGADPWLWFLPVDTLHESGYELDYVAEYLSELHREREQRQRERDGLSGTYEDEHEYHRAQHAHEMRAFDEMQRRQRERNEEVFQNFRQQAAMRAAAARGGDGEEDLSMSMSYESSSGMSGTGTANTGHHDGESFVSSSNHDEEDEDDDDDESESRSQSRTDMEKHESSMHDRSVSMPASNVVDDDHVSLNIVREEDGAGANNDNNSTGLDMGENVTPTDEESMLVTAFKQ